MTSKFYSTETSFSDRVRTTVESSVCLIIGTVYRCSIIKKQNKFPSKFMSKGVNQALVLRFTIVGSIPSRTARSNQYKSVTQRTNQELNVANKRMVR